MAAGFDSPGSKTSAAPAVAHATKAAARPQRTANRRSPLVVQAKLTVGSSTDNAEREADSIAQMVTGILRHPSGGDVSRDFAQAPASRIARKAVIGAAGGAVDTDVEQQINSARSGGRPLDGKIRRRMEGAFGADFSGVRMHVDEQSDQLNSKIQARAFTTGSDIFVRRKDYNPTSPDGETLLAHELAHTIQQGGATVSRLISRDPSESEQSESQTESNETESNSNENQAEEEETDENENETGEENENSEVDGEEDFVFTMPAIQSSEENVVGQGNLHEDSGTAPGSTKARSTKARSTKARSAKARSTKADTTKADTTKADTTKPDATKPSTARRTIDLVPLIGGVHGDAKAVSYSSVRAKSDNAIASIKTSATMSGNYAASAFGAMNSSYKVDNIVVKSKKGKIYVNLDLLGSFEYGTNSGGKTDVPSADAGVVTADTYALIASDLTPTLIEKSWRAPRTTYWSQAICERHEKYHATDFKGWFNKSAKGIVVNYLKNNPLELKDDEAKDQDKVKAAVKKALDEARDAVTTADGEYYTGGAATYLSYAGEERAFGDGKKPYLALAAGVEKQGKKLEAAAKKKSGAKA